MHRSDSDSVGADKVWDDGPCSDSAGAEKVWDDRPCSDRMGADKVWGGGCWSGCADAVNDGGAAMAEEFRGCGVV